MSGHSKWATTKHKKAALDQKRAKLFAKYIKNIEVASRLGGPDLEGNPALDLAVTKAKKQSVPNDNIDRAIKRGAGLVGGGVEYQNIMYEGYGPQGTAILIECLTENKNRAAADVRVAVSRNGGNMGDPGSVAYMFTRKGVIDMPKKDLNEDDVLLAVLDAGAEEVNDEGDSFEIISDAKDLKAISTALEDAGMEYESAESAFVPSVKVELDLEGAKKFMRLVDALEDLDDVQEIHSNADISGDVQKQLQEEE
ncbi:MAG: YebC/PmpR family DNA-binding transcriptional regulator [Micrococcaceae bacterium]